MSSAETGRPFFKYAGWVPTVNGRLSFRHIGEARHPKESIYANVTTASERLIVAFQCRPLSDVLFQTVTHYLCGYSGSFFFALTAKNPEGAASGNRVVGKVYVFKSPEDWKERGRDSTQRAIDRMRDASFSLSAERYREIETQYERAEKMLTASADIVFEFELQREGEIYFTLPKFLDAELEFASRNYAEQCGHDFSRWVANQGYFFVRDLAHTHQHHTASEDTILVLQQNDPEDIEWRRFIVFSLHFYIIRMKRSDNLENLIRAEGILGYCYSFTQICRRKFNGAEKIPMFNPGALSVSLQSRIAEKRWRAQNAHTAAIRRATTAANWRMYTLTLAVVAIALIAVFIPHYLEGNQYPALDRIGQFIAVQFAPLLWLIAIAVVLMWFLTTDLVLGWKDTLEASNPWRGGFSVFFSFAGGVVLILFAYFDYPAIAQIIEALRSLF